MKGVFPLLSILLLGWRVAETSHTIDLGRYFVSATAETQARSKVLAAANTFVASPTPRTADAALKWLHDYESLLSDLRRHQIYLNLRSEIDTKDAEDASANRAVGRAESSVRDRVRSAAADLGQAQITRWTADGPLTDYRYALEQALSAANHVVRPGASHEIDTRITPVLDTAASRYRELHGLSGPVQSHQEDYAALLISIAHARHDLARLRGFSSAIDAAYFDRSLTSESVERMLRAVRASSAFADYRRVASAVAHPAPQPLAIDDAIRAILAAEQPMGHEYSTAFAELLDPDRHRLEVCTASSCDDTGFSVGFAGVTSGAYFGGYRGTLSNARAVAHESGHAVHRELMNLHQPHAVYNTGPTFVFESFATFNELLFLDHQYRTAADPGEQAYYLNAELDDATFQVFGSAGETDLEAAIYRGLNAQRIGTAADLRELSTSTLAKYDPSAANAPGSALAWARNRLYFVDPLYDVNYLYAGVLALKYFTEFERAPQVFADKYLALLKNGFTDSPAALERAFLNIDLSDEGRLVADATAFIETRTQALARLGETEAR